jgi:general secretion pathway protein C
MEIYLKKYFWVLNLVVVGVCATLAAKGVNHIVEGKYLLPPAQPAARRPVLAANQPRPVDNASKKDDKLVVDRNIFCATCEPPKPVDTSAGPQVAYDPNNPPATSLPLVLLATAIASNDAAMSSATIANTSNNRSGSYWLGESIPEAGEITSIKPRWIDFKNKANGDRVERLDITGVAAPTSAPPVASVAPPPMPTPSGEAGDLTADIDKGVRKIDDTHYEIDRGLVDKIIGDPSQVMRQARIVPSIKDGKANGFKMYAIRPNGVYAKIGMQNGDTIHSINGYEITSPDKALEVYTKVKSASSLSMQLTRRGQPVSMEYVIK